jgi:sulfur-oxidizing protein SoxX
MMRKFGIRIGTMVSSIAMVAAFSITAHAADQATLEKGKQLAFERAKGNCLACHFIEGGNSPGNIGPGLVAMKSRFPDKAKLRAQIWDATAANPNTMMPPFGLNNALSDDEVDAITEFVYTL